MGVHLVLLGDHRDPVARRFPVHALAGPGELHRQRVPDPVGSILPAACAGRILPRVEGLQRTDRQGANRVLNMLI